MIYTSYYGKLREIPKDVVPIAISLKVPDGVNIYRYVELAPTQDMIDIARAGKYEMFEETYISEVLENLDVDDVAEELFDIAAEYDSEDLVLLCYEKGFCHRHIVRKWLVKSGYECCEWN